MEKAIKLKTGDNHLIYGVLNSKKKSDKLIIFVHGLTGHKNGHIFYNAAKFFTKQGFDTFRFDLYTGEKKGRTMRECDLNVHATDTTTVINYFKNRYKKIFLVGHSYGGPTILKSDTHKSSGIVLWDPSVSYRIIELLRHVKRIGKVNVLNWGVEFLISEHLCREWKNFPKPKDLVKNINVPIKIICAGNGEMTSRRK